MLVQRNSVVNPEDCTGPDVFMCDKAGRECISNQLKCNGVNDCSNGLDEDIATCGKGFSFCYGDIATCGKGFSFCYGDIATCGKGFSFCYGE